MSVPASRIRALNDAPLRSDRPTVLYWMTAARRCTWNFGLQRAAELARTLGRPLIVLEGLRYDHPYASERFSRFVLEGMRDNAKACAGRATYLPYLEPAPKAGSGLLAALAEQACAVVTDDFPTYFLPHMLESAARRLDVRFEAVDGNGLLPMAESDRMWPTARGFRTFIQKRLPTHLGLSSFPAADPLVDLPVPVSLPVSIRERWVPTDLARDDVPARQGPPPADLRGGAGAASERLDWFLREGLPQYEEGRNAPGREVCSRLSPYLHWGHISTHQVVDAVLRLTGASPGQLGGAGQRRGWWGATPDAEAFLDQLVTWRELGFNACHNEPRHREFDTLPAWARQTLAQHACDPRPHVYGVEQLRAAETHDRLWNAAQRQLLREGRIHNYLRMLWGKKILEWSPTPQEALASMIELNDRYALDGRDPNSYSGIFWTLGRYDRPWGPVRPIFGTVRYMSSDNTARKLDVKGYLARYAVI